MRIHNIRFGFANNSSSSHSLIFIKPGTVRDHDVSFKEFGWEHFTAASKEAKLDYLSLVLWYSLRDITSPEMAKVIVDKWCGIDRPADTPNDNTEDYPDGWIDHQSVINLPRTWDRKGIDLEFFESFKSYLLREDIAILGGNDNTEESHPLWNPKLDAGLPLDRDMGDTEYVARFDKVHDYWTVFNRENGAKVRFSFNSRKEPPQKAYAPELIDLKITDYCPYGCEFCYQDSTIQGKHASSSKLTRIVDALAKMKVFEVALGGGEPTLHPGFLNLVQDCRSQGIVPNFTTKNLAWISNHKFRDVVKATCGSFAFSANSGEEVMELAAALRTHNLCSMPVTIQCVMGVVNSWGFYNILRACEKNNLTLTILGYKDVGRGTEFTRKQEVEVIASLKRAIKEKAYPNICVDTEFASKYEEDLKKMKIPSWMYHTQEGKFSAYVDAVEEKIGPSSYCTEEKCKPLLGLSANSHSSENLAREILSAFREF